MTPSRRCARLVCLAVAWLYAVLPTAWAAGADPPKTSFRLPEGDAAVTLRQFSQQARTPIIYPIDTVRGVKTNAVQGEFTARVALDRMVAGTDLVVSQDERTGALTVGRPSRIPTPPTTSHPADSDSRPQPTEMKKDPTRSTSLVARTAAWLAFAFVPSLGAQTVAPAADQTLVLSPFEVKADARDSYVATNTNSITGTNVSLDRVPITANVLSRALLDDLAYTDGANALIEIAGFGRVAAGGADVGRGGVDGDNTSFGQYRARGLTVGFPRRDGLLRSNGSQLDLFSIERVEVIRGPQSLLYGSGDPGGIVNFTTKRAQFGARSGETRVAVDSEGTYRATAEAGWGNDQLALRAGGVREDRRFFRANLERNILGGFGTLAWRPVRNTTLRVEYHKVARDDLQANGTQNYAVTAPLADAARNNQPLGVLVALGQAGDLVNGRLNLDNVDSVLGDWAVRAHRHRYWGASLESRLRPNLALQLRYADDSWHNPSAQTLNTSPLRRPNDSANGLPGQWALGYQLGTSNFFQEQQGLRGTLTYDFTFLAGAKHQLIGGADRKKSEDFLTPRRYYLVDGAGAFVVNAAQRNNAEAGRTLMPIVWYSIERDFDGAYAYAGQREFTLGGSRYVLADQKVSGATAAVAGNPRGYNAGSGGVTDNRTRETAFFATLFSQWFGGRLDTLLGAREDSYRRERLAQGDVQGPFKKISKNLGAVYHLTPGLGLFGGYSSSLKVPTRFEPIFTGGQAPAGRGQGWEAGVKFDLLANRLSGSVAYYRADSVNDNDVTPANISAIADPVGINGRFVGGSSLTYDSKARGYEVTLTARPSPAWQIRLGYQHAQGTEGRDVRLPILYNDQFNTTTVGGQPAVGVGSGATTTALMVPSIPGNATSPLVPLTVAMLRDRTSPYFAQLDPESGRINNAAALGLTAAGVGTGRTGLPIAQHQLGFTPTSADGTVLARRGGDKTVGYPEDAFSVVSSYRFAEGALKRLRVGGSVVYQVNRLGYYYTDSAGARRLYKLPEFFQTTLFTAYDFKLSRKLGLELQLNVANLFDAQDILLQPRITNGTPGYARFNYSPRLYTLTTVLRF